MKEITIVGAGLAGCEAALQLAERGWKVNLYEMRPHKMTPAHHTGLPAELVCSNSLKSDLITTASGLLKAELRLLNCKLLDLAEKRRVPAGNALAIDRILFAEDMQQILESHPNIELIREEVKEIPEPPVIIATGPLTSDRMVQSLLTLLGEEQLYFFDAIAPIVSADSIDMDICYSKSRYDKGESDYLNCPFNKEEYLAFVEALRAGEKHEAHEFENQWFRDIGFQFYENCVPIEELASRDKDTLRYGVMRPVGLEDPRTDRRPWAAIQLRAENSERTAYNLVGCQTMLRYPEQKRIFRLIPGLENANFERFGSIHRNTYLNSPGILNKDLSLRKASGVYLAGQLSGVEGYIESITGGLLAALSVAGEYRLLPETTIIGQLQRHITTPMKNFQPMNANYGLLPPLEENIRDKKKKKQALSDRAIEHLQSSFE